MRKLLMITGLLVLWSTSSMAFEFGPTGAVRDSKAVRILAQSAVAVPLTGTVNETTLATYTVPGGSMGANGAVRVTLLFSAGAVNANAKTVRVKWGSGAVTVFSVSIANQKSGQGMAVIRNRNSTTSQVAHSPFVYGLSADASNAPVTASADTASGQTITITGQLGNSGDTFTLEGYTVELLPGVN